MRQERLQPRHKLGDRQEGRLPGKLGGLGQSCRHSGKGSVLRFFRS